MPESIISNQNTVHTAALFMASGTSEYPAYNHLESSGSSSTAPSKDWSEGIADIITITKSYSDIRTRDTASFSQIATAFKEADSFLANALQQGKGQRKGQGKTLR
jgi:hypothetical protein